MGAAERLDSPDVTSLALWNQAHFATQLIEIGEPQIVGLLAAFKRYLADTRDALVTARLNPSLAATVRHDLAPIAAFLGFEQLADICGTTSAVTLHNAHCWNELYDLMMLVERECELRLQRHG